MDIRRKFQIAYLGHFWRIGRERHPTPDISGTGLSQGQRFHRLAAGAADLLEQLLGGNIEWHAGLLLALSICLYAQSPTKILDLGRLETSLRSLRGLKKACIVWSFTTNGFVWWTD
jgi:hypothetical protein